MPGVSPHCCPPPWRRPGGPVAVGPNAQVSLARDRIAHLQLKDPGPFRQGKTIRYGLMSLDARVLGRLAKAAEPMKP